ncbi:hypothetical protein NVP1081O_192 [Vibrio phage 1.081.O._10N.286.52.C2]|nr:hypothetical protein NVP1081O_192 [Vibrio phage 1.081.O._10N.286.52.C2]
MYTDIEIFKTNTCIKSVHGLARVCNVAESPIDGGVEVYYLAVDEFTDMNFADSELPSLDSQVYVGTWSKKYITSLGLVPREL